MGMCFSETKSTSTIRKTTTQQRSVRISKPNELIIDINPQNIQETQFETLSPAPTIMSVPSSANSPTKAKSMISLEEALMNENIETEENVDNNHLSSWMESHNAPNSLMKMSKSKIIPHQNQSLHNETTKSMINQLENCEDVCASLRVNHQKSSIVLSSSFIDIEFILPKGRAGPLVVPYICYQNYGTKKGQGQQ